MCCRWGCRSCPEQINVVSQEVKDEIEREEKRAAELAEAESQHFKRKVQEVEDAAGKDAKRAKAGAKDLDRCVCPSARQVIPVLRVWYIP